MRNQVILYAVLASQVALISIYLPVKLLARARHIVASYPPSKYARLYAASPDEVEPALRRYRIASIVAAVAVVALIIVAAAGPGDALFAWNGGSVVAGFWALQLLPQLLLMSRGFPYFNAQRLPDHRPTRRAVLRPRRVSDFVSPTLLGAAASVYVAFALLVVYIRQFDYPWFGGFANIGMITLMNVSFATIVLRAIYGRPRDPYQTSNGRARDTARLARVLVATSIAATLFVALNISLHALDLEALDPIALSLYLQLLGLISFRTYRIQDTDFEVYRHEPAAAS